MTLLRFDPPGHLRDFDHIPNQLQQWSAAVSGWIDGGIQIEKQRLEQAKHPQAQVQFFNATRIAPVGLSLDQAIVWNAFPRTLVLGYGSRAAAFPESEKLISLTAPRPGLPTAPTFYQDPPDHPGMWSSLYYRPLDEYCEWRVERAADTGKIQRITFTSEPPEYWQALHGDKLQDVNGNFAYQFTGDKQHLLALYREFVSPEVQLADLACQQDYFYLDNGKKVPVFRKGDYNPYNVWNSTKGLMHLAHPNNFVAAEIQLGCDATLLRHKNHQPVVQADALVCCAGYGGTSRSSDPTIGASVNDLARLGAWVTIKNPIGLYMHDLNTEGFTKPNGEPIDPQEYFRVLRGDQKAGMIERAVFEVPASEGFTVGDICIGGVPIAWGGQVAEHLNITITGTAVAPGTFQNPLLPCATFCAINQTLPRALTRVISKQDNPPAGYQEVFLHEQGTFGNAAKAETALAEANARLQPAAPEPLYDEPNPVPRHKRR